MGTTKPKTSPLIHWRREAWKDEELEDLPGKGREKAIVNQTIGTISKARLGKLLRDARWGGMHMGFSECKDTILN